MFQVPGSFQDEGTDSKGKADVLGIANWKWLRVDLQQTKVNVKLQPEKSNGMRTSLIVRRKCSPGQEENKSTALWFSNRTYLWEDLHKTSSRGCVLHQHAMRLYMLSTDNIFPAIHWQSQALFYCICVVLYCIDTLV